MPFPPYSPQIIHPSDIYRSIHLKFKTNLRRKGEVRRNFRRMKVLTGLGTETNCDNKNHCYEPSRLALTRSTLRPTLLVTDCSRQWTIEGGPYRRTRDMVTNRKQTMNDSLLRELIKFIKSTKTSPSFGARNAARHRPLSAKARRLNEAIFSTSRRQGSQ
jgi:hypothetical protein